MSRRHGRLWALWKAAAVALLLTVLRPPRAFNGTGVGSRKPPSARCPRLAVEAEQEVAVNGIQEESPIPLRDAAAQSMVDSQFLERLNASATPAELLELLATRRNNLRLAESTRVFQKLLELTSVEEVKKLTQEAILVEVLRFQVDALKTLQLPPALIISLASLGQQLESLHEGKVLLTTALQALKPKNMRVSEMRAVLTSPLAGIKELRGEILDAMSDTVHRMSPEVMVVVLNTLAEYQEQPEELLDEVIARVEEKSFRMTPNEGLGVLYALARLEKFNLALLQHFGNEAAVDISPFSLQELSQWAEVLRRLNFRNRKLLDILVKVTTWRGESMSDEQLNTMLLCFKHFKVSKESTLPIEEIARMRVPHGGASENGEEKNIDA